MSLRASNKILAKKALSYKKLCFKPLRVLPMLRYSYQLKWAYYFFMLHKLCIAVVVKRRRRSLWEQRQIPNPQSWDFAWNYAIATGARVFSGPSWSLRFAYKLLSQFFGQIQSFFWRVALVFQLPGKYEASFWHISLVFQQFQKATLKFLVCLWLSFLFCLCLGWYELTF